MISQKYDLMQNGQIFRPAICRLSFFLGLSILFIVPFSASAQIEFKTNSYERILAKAKKKDKLIFVDCYTEWCGPCKWMDRNVFCQDSVGDFYNDKFINWKLDMESQDGKLIEQLFAVKAYPTFLFLNSDGQMIHQSYGTKSLPEMLQLGYEATIDTLSLSYYEAKYQSGAYDQGFLKSYAEMLSRNRLPGAMDIAHDYIQGLKSWEDRDNLEFIYDFVGVDTESFAYQLVVENKSTFFSVVRPDELNNKLANIISIALGPDPNMNHADMLIDQAFPEGNHTLYAMKARLLLLEDKQDELSKQQFVMHAINHCTANYKLNWSDLNNYAWLIAEKTEDHIFLTEAVNIAIQSIEKQESYYNYDTLAYLCYKLDQLSEAEKHATKAIKLAIEAGADYGDTQLLLKDIIIAKAAQNDGQ